MDTEKLIESEEKVAEDIKQQMKEAGYDVNDADTARKVIEDYTNDKDVRENAAYWAQEFENKFRGNWFTLEKVMKKTIFKNIEQALQVLQIMSLCGFCHVTKENGKLKYKVTLNPQEKIELMRREKIRLEEAYKQDLADLNCDYEIRRQSLDVEIKKLSDTLN